MAELTGVQKQYILHWGEMGTGWQRAMRYKKRCDLFLYTEEQLRQIFSRFPEATATIEPASRDYFVTLARNKKAT